MNHVRRTVGWTSSADPSGSTPSFAPGGGPSLLAVWQIVHSDDADLQFLVDADGDGTFEVDVTIHSLTGDGAFMFSFPLDLAAGQKGATRQVLRITNSSGGPSDYSVHRRDRSGHHVRRNVHV